MQKIIEAASEAIRNGATTSKGVTLAGLVRRRNEEADWFLSGGLPTGIALFGTKSQSSARSGWRVIHPTGFCDLHPNG